MRDKVGSIVRPVKELKDFQKVMVKVGETKQIKFIIDNEKLCFYNKDLDYKSEAGEFDLMIGSSSDDIRLHSCFELID